MPALLLAALAMGGAIGMRFFARGKIDATVDELKGERDSVKELGLI